MSYIRLDSPTGYYHVIQRGTGKQVLFEDHKDYLQYLKKLSAFKSDYEFELPAYCLMPNHTHLLINADLETLSKLIHRLGTSYARYFNGKYEHVGHVFQGRYLSEPITDESYLRACIRYIHNNPVKAGLGKRKDYQWSSYNEYIYGGEIADTSKVLDVLGGVEPFITLCESAGQDRFLDYNSLEEKTVIGMEIIRKELGEDCKSGLVVKSLEIPKRNEIITKLKQNGLSHKQIELLTGVSKAIIARCKKVNC